MDRDRTNEQPRPLPQIIPPPDATAESFFAAVCPKKDLVIPGIGRVWVHGLTDIEVQQWLDSCDRDEKDPDRIKDPYQNAKLLQRTVRSASGQPIWSLQQIPRIAGLPNVVKKVLLDEAKRLSGMGDEVEAEILKNCVTTPAGGS